jgi:Cyclin, N-terminal domain
MEHSITSGSMMEHSIKDSRCMSIKVSHPQHLSQMLEREVEMRSTKDHQALTLLSSRCCPNLIWREKVTQWCYDVVDHLDISRGIVFVAMNILDRYSALRNLSATNERDYETAALTALFLSLRISGGTSSLDVHDLVRMSRLGVSIQEIVAVGKAMTGGLTWDSRILTPIDFCNAFVGLLPLSDADTSKESILETCNYLAEISVCDTFFSGVAASKVAFAAILNAVGWGNRSRLSELERTTFFAQINALYGLDCDDVDISALSARLHLIYKESQDNNQTGPHLILDSDDDMDIVVSVPVPLATRVVSQEQLSSSRPILRSMKSSSLVHSSPILSRDGNSKRAVTPSTNEQPFKRHRSTSY